MRISAVLNIQDSGLVVTQIFLYFPLFKFSVWSAVLNFCNLYGRIVTATSAKQPYTVLCTTLYKTTGCWSLFQLHRQGNGHCRREIYRRSWFRQPRGIGPRPHDFGSLKCIDLFTGSRRVVFKPLAASVHFWLTMSSLPLGNEPLFNHLCKRCKQRVMSTFPNCPVLRHDLRSGRKTQLPKQIFLYSPLFFL